MPVCTSPLAPWIARSPYTCVEGESSPASCQPKQEWLVLSTSTSYRCYPQVGIRGTRPWDSKYCSTDSRVVSNGSKLLTTYCGVKASDELYSHTDTSSISTLHTSSHRVRLPPSITQLPPGISQQKSPKGDLEESRKASAGLCLVGHRPISAFVVLSV